MFARSRSRARRGTVAGATPVPILAGGDFAAQAVGAATSLYGLTFTRASTATTHDYAAGTITAGIAVDTARIAKTAATRIGLLNEPSRTNRLVRSQDPRSASGWTYISTPTVTRPSGTGPDGSATTPTRIQASASPLQGVYRSVTLSTGTPSIMSYWIRAQTGTDTELIGISTVGGGSPGAGASPGTTSWKRRITATASATSAAANAFAADGRGNTLFSGVSFGPTALDQVVDYGQVETGRWASSAIPTQGSTVLRAADALAVPSATVVTGQSLRFHCTIEVPAARASLGELTGTTLTIFAAGSYYATMSTSTGVITVGGRDLGDTAFVTDTTIGSIALAANDVIELWIVLGGGLVTTVEYSRNGGAVVSMPMTSGTGMIVATAGAGAIGASIDLLHDAGAAHLPGVVLDLAFYAAGQYPPTFAPTALAAETGADLWTETSDPLAVE